jgi:hypothetical protein
MRYREIITTETIGDTWQQRHAAFRREQAKRAKLQTKIATAKADAARQRRAAADRQASTNDKLRRLQRELATTATKRD